MFGSNSGCICKIHLKLGFNVNLSHSLQFEVGLYVKSKIAKVSQIQASQKPWKYRCNDCCQSVGCGRKSINLGVIQAGVGDLALLGIIR